MLPSFLLHFVVWSFEITMNLNSVFSLHVNANHLSFLFVTLGSILPVLANIANSRNDQESLLVFKDKVNDPFGSLSSWNSSVPFCQWHGVTCGRRHRRVIELKLRHQSLTGSLSPYIGNLSFLRILDLGNNSFSQNIPSQLGYLTRLRILYLQNNSFEGKIPANISTCSRLVEFWANNNKLSGMLPMELGSLSMLEVLVLASNNLVGEIPVSYGNLSSLQQFFLYENAMEGKIPNAIGRLSNLQFLDFDLNSFSGLIPSSLFNISALVLLDLSRNQLLGTLPQDFGIIYPNLEFLSIRNNQFSGSLPISLSNMSSLAYFSIGYNKFSGEVPNFKKLHRLSLLDIGHNQFGSGKVNDFYFISSLKNATVLEKLYLESNGFGGILPDSFKNLSRKLQILNLSGNKIHGDIPIWTLKYVNLEAIDLSKNQFSGIIPQEIGKLRRLQYLYFYQNRISGFIPSSFSNMTVLTNLYLHDNNLVDKIPSSLGRCQSLLNLLLYGNKLTGSIPREVLGLSSLIALDLSDNQLSGEIPEEVGNLKNLVQLVFSSNRFTGEIPSTLGSCVTLEFLRLGENFFQGVIPSTLEALQSLEVLDLSHNNLSGEIPLFLQDFNLEMLNLSFNDFQGAIPEGGIFQNLSEYSVDNNLKLCGGLPALQLPKCNSTNGTSKFVSSTAFKLVISLVLGFLGLITVLGLFLLIRAKKSIRNSSFSNTNKPLIISYQGLLKATNGFSESNLIGVGSYGSVYKGILDDDNLIVAVKVLNMLQHGASRSFTAECDALRNIRHRNLVKILTACSGFDYNCNEFKALIYEFMVNGNLDEWLHQSNPQDQNDTCIQPKRLNFLQRLNIAIDVASALDYLHNDCETSVVHCDLKPSNVLLDNELVACVGDFGLARILPSETKTPSVETTSTIIKGSIGYTAPEYGMGSKPSTHGDVYSFGILLLEIFTGKRPTDDMFKDAVNLHCYVKNALPNKVAEVVDPEIVSFMVETHKNIEGLISIFRTGVACSSYSIIERKNMKDVVRQLCSIRDVLLHN